jgi:predicted flap endonuclease-1-like 5' DNA nuclease
MDTLFYILLAFIVGLLLGWFLWGRLRGELDSLRADRDHMRGERDRLKADMNLLHTELDACRSTRGDLERQLRDTKPAAPPALTLVPATAPASPATPVQERSKAGAVKAKPGKPKAARAADKDNLRRLIGIGPVNERRLNAHGITTFAQIAAWTAADIKEVEEYLRFGNRVERERWVEQAQLLAAGDEAGFLRRFPAAGGSGNT